MSYIFRNPNPKGHFVGDCVIRALSIATGKDWGTVYLELCILGYKMGDMPSSNRVWGSYLKNLGFTEHDMYDKCKYCYTVKDFCREFRTGTYILGTGSHVLTVIDRNYYDSWDSGDVHPIYFWKKETS